MAEEELFEANSEETSAARTSFGKEDHASKMELERVDADG